jgi:succinate dehydrogenase / fumarate reductase, iron-sulfur subunit
VEITLRIKRYDPETDATPHFEEYRIDGEPMDRVLDALNTIKWQQDGTLTYRRSCGHGVCGSDAMRINGRNRLACKVLLQDLGQNITIEPLIGFTVIKDHR